MKLLEPWINADSVAAIDLEMLKEQGVDTLLLDMDNTIVPWHTFSLSDATNLWIRRAGALGFKICILSNNRKWRIVKITEMLGVRGVWSACKPFFVGYMKALRILGSKRRSSVCVGDQIFTDIVGANLLGIRTILVCPVSRREYGWTRFMRRVEAAVAGRDFEGKAEERVE